AAERGGQGRYDPGRTHTDHHRRETPGVGTPPAAARRKHGGSSARDRRRVKRARATAVTFFRAPVVPSASSMLRRRGTAPPDARERASALTMQALSPNGRCELVRALIQR